MDNLFSFDYTGHPFPEGFTRQAGSAGVWAHPSGLTVTVESTSDPDTGGQEWTLWFENRGKADSAPLTNVYPLDARAAFTDGCTVTTAKGTSGKIDDFALATDALAPGEPKEYASCGSRAYIPFFNVGGEHAGAVCALGWTGRWFAKVEAHAGGARVTGGMPSTGFYLRPGEQVRTPRVLWLPWTGRRMDAHNALRRHLVKKMPKGADGQPQAPICFGTWGGMKTVTHKKLIEFIKDQGFCYDLYWIDAGWYGDDHETEEFQNFANEDWYFHVGNWRVNHKVHPDGLRPVTDAAHAAGMKVLLWFHSLDCHSHLGWYKDHPEWGRITWDGIAPCVTKHFKDQTTRAKVASAYLDDPAAAKFIGDTIGGLLKEHGADCYREDTSFPCGHPDESGRDGIGEMKAVQNYYAFWDSLRAQNPGLLIDSCGGGGTHIDLETVARSYVLHRSDYVCYPGADPIGSQVGNYGLGHFVPLPCGGMGGAGDTYAFRSSLNGGKAFSFELKFDQDGKALIGELEGYPFDWHRRMLEEFQTVKPYLWGDFYPLTACDTATDRVLAYQLDRPDLGSGVIFAFRRQDCETQSFRVMPELEKGVRYVFDDIEGGNPACLTGGEAFEIAIADKRGSRLILYRKVTETGSLHWSKRMQPRRLFADDSYWNTPLRPQAEADPESDRLLAIMAEKGTLGFWLNLDYWTIPVYEADADTPRCDVRQFLSRRLRGAGGWIGSTDLDSPRHNLGHTRDFNPVPIPAHAVPSREEDAHMTIVDWQTLTAWDMLAAARAPDGGWTAATGIRYRLDGPGVFGLDQFPIRDGESIHYFGPGRASGVPIVAGLIMHEEIRAGRIEHRLAFCSPCSALRRFIYPPAVWTDGPYPDGIPEGAVVQLDPALDLDRFSLSAGARVVARALQEYGAVNTDTGGANALYGEGLWAQPGRTWDDLLAADGLMAIPLRHYRVLRLDAVIDSGMSHGR